MVLEPSVPTAIFDLDGTICDTRHRVHHLQKSPKDWDAWNAAVVDDTPHQYVIDLALLLRVAGVQVVVFSGRMVTLQRETIVQLEKFRFPYSLLTMRKAGDYRPDTVVKLEMLQALRGISKVDIKFAVDDRPDVVKMWRDNGVPCLVVEQEEWVKQVWVDGIQYAKSLVGDLVCRDQSRMPSFNAICDVLDAAKQEGPPK